MESLGGDYIVKEIAINATPAEVWAAITSARAIAETYFGALIPRVNFNPVIGEEWEISFEFEDTHYKIGGTVFGVEPQKRLVYSFKWIEGEQEEETKEMFKLVTMVEWELNPMGPKRTRLTLKHSGWEAQPEEREEHDAHWAGILGRLRAYIESRSKK